MGDASTERESKALTDTSCIREPVTLIINGCSVQVGHNLYLALLHLRSLKTPLSLWVDAVCINSEDTKERNAQVAMMSFIYSRALKVVAWLGIKEHRSLLDQFRSMSIDWKAGQSQHFAASVTGVTRLRCTLEPDLTNLARIAKSSYWSRLWIVQELCLPRVLVFAYGASIWTEEELQKHNIAPARDPERRQSAIGTQAGTGDRFDAMYQLLDLRRKRYTDAMRLENLIERFPKSGCTELRDRVYGLLGLASDVRPLSKVDTYADSGQVQVGNPSERSKGAGFLQVDYSYSFYEIWSQIVKLLFFQAQGLEGSARNVITSRPSDMATYPDEERQTAIVRLAGIVQDALDQMVEQDVVTLDFPKVH